MKFHWRHIFLLFSFALSSCVVSAPPLSPQALGARSLVLGRITAVDAQGHAEAPPATADLRIDGTRYAGVVRRGYFAVALGPGIHRLESVLVDRGGVHLTRPLNRTLDVKPGRNLDVGLLILWFGHDPRGNGYRILAIDNRKEMRAWLEHIHPALGSAVGQRDFDLATYPYLRRDQLRLLRQEVVKRLVLHDRGMWPLVAGPIGTVARLQAGDGKRVASIHLFASRTLGDFHHCVQARDRMDCSLLEGGMRSRIMEFDGKRIVYRELPPDFVPQGIFLSRDNTLYVADAALRILSLQSGRGRWHRFDASAGGAGRLQSRAVYFQQAPAGLFINTSGPDGTILFRDHATGEYIRLNNPGREVSLWNIAAVPGGILLGGSRGQWYRKSYVFFRPSGATNWDQRKTPASGCIGPLIPVIRKNIVSAVAVRCGGGVYVTRDRGTHWRQVLNGDDARPGGKPGPAD